MLEVLREWDGHGVAIRHDAPSDAWFFIAIHDPGSGRAVGGTRTRRYPTPADGLREATRLAEAMTYKWAALDVDLGGAKAVISLTRDLRPGEREAQLRRFAELIDGLHGAFGTGPDLGTTPEEIAYMGGFTRYVHCYDPDTGRPIDPGPYTALGVFVGIQAALEHRFGDTAARGRSVLIQGVGDVGAPLARMLAEAGARVLVSDIDARRAGELAFEIGAEVVGPDDVIGTDCDVYAPCAIAGTINARTIPELRCRIVAGAANTQLATPEDAEQLRARGILYAPDYVVNGGGAATLPLMGTGIPDSELRERVRLIGPMLLDIFREADARGESPVRVAQRRADAVLDMRRRARRETPGPRRDAGAVVRDVATRVSGFLSALLLLAVAACGAGQPGDAAAHDDAYDLVLAGGRVIDPETRLDAVRNVGIREGRIAAVSEMSLHGAEVVDVTGLVVAPGFIDLHAHGQDSVSSRLQVRDGVTTALEMESGVMPVAAFYAAREGRWPVNFGATASHMGARVHVMHGEDLGHRATNPLPLSGLGENPDGLYRAATEAEVADIGRRLLAGVDEGALGFGFGINYTPGAEPGEIRELFRLAAQRDVPVFVHTRAFGIEPVREAIAHAEAHGTRLHIVHVASSCIRDVPVCLAAIDSARARGLRITTEAYPYTAGSTLLQSAIFDPGWQQNLGIGYGDLEWPATGERLTAQTFARYREQGGWVILHFIPEAMVDMAIAAPGVMIASDGVPFIDGRAHPRGAGTYARVLGRYAREQGTISLMEAIAKASLYPARLLEGVSPKMAAKGRVQVGADADLVVFDPATVIDRATFAEPAQPSAGIPHVLVNGVFVVRDGELVPGATPGRGVRSGGTRHP